MLTEKVEGINFTLSISKAGMPLRKGELIIGRVKDY